MILKLSMIVDGCFVLNHEIRRQRLSLHYDESSQCWVIADVDASLAIGPPDWYFTDQQILFPSFIDIHVHAREDSSATENYKEDFTSASLAARNGGVSAFMEMPNNRVDPPRDLESYRRKVFLIARSIKQTSVPIVPYVLIDKNSTGAFSFKVPYKVYYGVSVNADPHTSFANKDELKEVLAKYPGEMIAFHCEHPSALKRYVGESTHGTRRPPSAEVDAIHDVIELAVEIGFHPHICHLSTKEGAELCLNAKKRKIPLTFEVAPHHLYFSSEMLESEAELQKISSYFHVNPPIREERDRLYLLEIVKKGLVDFFATDHAPHTLEEKLVKGFSGFPQLDTYGLFIEWLLKYEKVSPVIIAKMCTYAACNFFNPFWESMLLQFPTLQTLNLPKLGQIEKNFLGDFYIVDLYDKEVFSRLTKENLKTKNQHSPFLYRPFTKGLER
ncbi:MAG: amidohydrolase family protein [Oligoflexia bacterium]|nr:amidohydrolase family protein [Oligoflexia bacterium]MBF0364649.1 amidohydrolase family protein [Oligoflexia bacterium]